jgi:hypothetical protein
LRSGGKLLLEIAGVSCCREWLAMTYAKSVVREEGQGL